ncbi:MAG: alpha-glucosidase, partial [Alphaproteobacteria bacterium]|nr:alpha-glucosidase [Alphaproteobacteria bacterium]
GHLIHAQLKASAITKLLQDVKTHFDNPGKMCWSLGNHDILRLWSRFATHENPKEAWRLLIAAYFCLEGYLCWYQGDELGLSEANIPLEQIQDPFGISFWPEFKGRDGCRTPMPWDKDLPEAGFTSGKAWLPVPPDQAARAVTVQEGDGNSLLEYTRACMKLRRDNPALQSGSTTLLETGRKMVGFIREKDGRKILCLFNFDEKNSHAFHYDLKKILFDRHTAKDTLLPYGVLIAEI